MCQSLLLFDAEQMDVTLGKWFIWMPVQRFNRTGQGQGDLRLQHSQGFLLDKALDWNSQDLSSVVWWPSASLFTPTQHPYKNVIMILTSFVTELWGLVLKIQFKSKVVVSPCTKLELWWDRIWTTYMQWRDSKLHWWFNLRKCLKREMWAPVMELVWIIYSMQVQWH